MAAIQKTDEIILRGNIYDGEEQEVPVYQNKVVLPIRSGHVVYVRSDQTEFGKIVFRAEE